ncbi:MAG: hypothetical protein RLZZ568_330, partial [Cyanobacteriota bacterium]
MSCLSLLSLSVHFLDCQSPPVSAAPLTVFPENTEFDEC